MVIRKITFASEPDVGTTFQIDDDTWTVRSKTRDVHDNYILLCENQDGASGQVIEGKQ